VPQRRLEDRIHALVNRAVATHDRAELDHVIHELRTALHEHANRLRKLAAAKLMANPRAKAASAIPGNPVADDMAAD
jgi:hypothetical protein